MKLKSTLLLLLLGAWGINSTIYAVADAAQAAQPSGWRRAWNNIRSNAQSFFNPMAGYDQDDEPEVFQPAVAPEPEHDEAQARPFSSQAQEFVHAQYNQARELMNHGRQRIGQAVNNGVQQARSAIRERIRQELVGAVQAEIHDVQHNPQRQAELIANARNMAAAAINSRAGQEAVAAARAQIPNVINGVAAEMQRPENVRAFENMADQLLHGNHQQTVFAKIREAIMENTRPIRWGLTSFGVLGSICLAYKIGVWLKNKFFGPLPAQDVFENELPDSFEDRNLRNRVFAAQPELMPNDELVSAQDRANVAQAVGRHQAFLKSQKLNATVREMAKAQLEVLQRANNNVDALANLKLDLGNLAMAFDA